MASAVTGLNAHTLSPRISNASSLPQFSSPSNTLSVPVRKHPFHHLPRLRRFQKPYFSASNTWSNSRGVAVCSISKLGETQPISLEENPRHLAEKLPGESGVYAIHDKSGELQYIGISRTISKSVLSHTRDVPELCGSVKIAVVEPGRTGSGLTNAWKVWMNEHIEGVGKIPLGNDAWNETWKKKEEPIKADLRLKPDCYAEWKKPLEQVLEQLIHENEVLAFIKGSRTAPRCPLSCKALAIFYEQRINYETIDVLDELYNPGLGKALKAFTGFPTIPQVFVHGKFIGGVDGLNEMAEKGELYELFLKQRQKIIEGNHDGESEGEYEVEYEGDDDEESEGEYEEEPDVRLKGLYEYPRENYYDLTDDEL